MKTASLLLAGVALAFSPLPAAAERPGFEPKLHWYKCNTHTHTSARPNSDANGSPEFVAEWYRNHGYHCIVITDHEYLTDVTALNEKYARAGDFLLIQGQEITQAIVDPDPLLPHGLRHTHVNGLNLARSIMPIGFPKPAHNVTAAETYERNFSAVREAGGLPQINHPNLHWSVGLNDLVGLAGPYLLEIWNAFPTSNNLGGASESGAVTLSTEQLWDALLSRGITVWAVASDDAHEYVKFDDRESPTPGKAWIVVRAASLTTEAVMDALHRGDFYASTGITLESYSVDERGISIVLARNKEWVPAFKGHARVRTRFIGAEGEVLAEETGLSPRYVFRGNERYVRASIIDSDGRRAWTQPVFRDGRDRASRPPASVVKP